MYIGIHGYAGSGKDTVTKMIRHILSKKWESLKDCYDKYFEIYTDPTRSATFGIDENQKADSVLCIAFADQLKLICSDMFGIPTDRFYKNKNTAWVCLNHDFRYTETQPQEEFIVDAQTYYDRFNEFVSNKDRYWMSLRELLVYIGTYVLQRNVNKNIFVNIVDNICHNEMKNNPMLNHVICTDVRFQHEIDFIRSKHGILINVTRNDVEQLDNIAEHELDDQEYYDYEIDNSGSYGDLFMQVWEIINDPSKVNYEFMNRCIDLKTDDELKNYVRIVEIKVNKNVKSLEMCLRLCNKHPMQHVKYDDGDISEITIGGNTTITIGTPIEVDPTFNNNNKIDGQILRFIPFSITKKDNVYYDNVTDDLFIYANVDVMYNN